MEKAVRCWRTAARTSPCLVQPVSQCPGRLIYCSAETTVIPFAFAITGVDGSAIAVSIGCHCPSAGRCMPICWASRSMRARSFSDASSRLSARFDSAMASRCDLQLLDLVAVLDRAEVLPQIHHHEQEQHAQA